LAAILSQFEYLSFIHINSWFEEMLESINNWKKYFYHKSWVCLKI